MVLNTQMPLIGKVETGTGADYCTMQCTQHSLSHNAVASLRSCLWCCKLLAPVQHWGHTIHTILLICWCLQREHCQSFPRTCSSTAWLAPFLWCGILYVLCHRGCCHLGVHGVF